MTEENRMKALASSLKNFKEAYNELIENTFNFKGEVNDFLVNQSNPFSESLDEIEIDSYCTECINSIESRLNIINCDKIDNDFITSKFEESKNLGGENVYFTVSFDENNIKKQTDVIDFKVCLNDWRDLPNLYTFSYRFINDINFISYECHTLEEVLKYANKYI